MILTVAFREDKMTEIQEQPELSEKITKSSSEVEAVVRKDLPENGPFWSRRMTNVLKTIAIILMFCHHFFMIPDYHPDNINYPWASFATNVFGLPTKICVGIFAFITGYMYCFNKNKNYKYAMESIWGLLKQYWTVAIPLIILSIATGVSKFDIVGIIKTLTGYSSEVMRFGWYVYFFTFLMLFFPFLVRISKDDTIVFSFLSLILFNILACILFYRIDKDAFRLRLAYSNIWGTSLTAFSGYLVAKTGLFFKWKSFTDRIPTVLRYITFLLLADLAFMFPDLFYHWLFVPFRFEHIRIGLFVNAEFIYVPVFVFCLVELFSFIEKPHFNSEKKTHPLVRFFEIFGKYSTFLWFWHCMFFGVLGKYTKSILYAPYSPVFVLIWGFMICLSLSFVSEKFLQFITPKKHRSVSKEG